MSQRSIEEEKAYIREAKRWENSTYFNSSYQLFNYGPSYVDLDSKLAVSPSIYQLKNYYIPEDISDYIRNNLDTITPKSTLKEWLNQPKVKEFYLLKAIRELC